MKNLLLHYIKYTYGRYQRLMASIHKMRLPGDTYIDPSVHIIGWSQFQIGSNSVVSQGCWINVNNRRTEEKSIQIGNNCFIGKNNFFSVGKRIIIRDYCLTTLDCKFVGSSHIYENPFAPYITTGVTAEDEIYVGVNCFFGVNSMVAGNVKVGHGSVIGSGAVVREDVPPFSVVVGDPGRIIKRYDFQNKEWRTWTGAGSSDGPGEEEYLDILKRNYPLPNMPLKAASKRNGDL